MSTPLTCPFCNQPPVVHSNAMVNCQNEACYVNPRCISVSPREPNANTEAVRRWNTRSNDAKLRWFEELWLVVQRGSRNELEEFLFDNPKPEGR